MTLHSEISLPCHTFDGHGGEVLIRYGQILEEVDSPHYLSSKGVTFQAEPGKLLLWVRGVARFMISDGVSIVVEPEENCSEEVLKLFLLGPVLAGILHQRGALVLHGSAILTDKGAVIFLGDSGSGKSTLAAGFLKKGYSIIADDLSVINILSCDRATIHHGLPRLKLWEDSCDILDYSTTGLARVSPNSNKFVVPVLSRVWEQSLPIGAIYWIRPSPQPTVSITSLSGSEKTMTLIGNTYRSHYLVPLGLATKNFDQCLRLAKQVLIYQIHRPDKGDSLSSLISLVEQSLHTGGISR